MKSNCFPSLLISTLMKIIVLIYLASLLQQNSVASTETEWSLSCDQSILYGAIDRSVTLPCRLHGAILDSADVTFYRINWLKLPEESTALEVVKGQGSGPDMRSDSAFQDRVSLLGTGVSLTIDKLTTEHFGTYKLEVMFAKGVIFENPKEYYVVLEEAHGPAGVRILGNRPIRFDNLLVLKCKAEDVNPKPRMQWLHNNALVNVTVTFESNVTTDANGRRQMDVVHEYNFVPSREQNGDRIECRVTNDVNGVERTDSVKLNVTFPPAGLELRLRHKHSIYIVADVDSLTVTCALRESGNPPSELTLLRDGVVLKSEVAPSLDFKTLVGREDDNAEFRCVAKNSIAELRTEARGIKVAFGPVSVVINASRTEARAGETVSLYCVVEGSNPAPEVQWLKGSELFQIGSVSNQIPEDREGRFGSKIQIELSPQDKDAEYFCQAVHKVSQQTVKSGPVTFGVLYPCDSPSIHVVGVDDIWSVHEGHILPEVECRLARPGNPVAVLTLVKSNRTLATAKGTNLTHRINPFTAAEDGAELHCQAENPLTGSPLLSRKVTVDVAFGPTELVIQPAFNGLVVGEVGEVVNILCRAVDSKPPADVEWIDCPFHSTVDPLQCHPQTGVTTVSLQLKVSEFDNNKSFSCRAENRRTRIVRQSPVTLKVLYPPKWIKDGRRTHSAKVGSMKQLVCPIAANPPVNKWKWFFEDKELPNYEYGSTKKSPFNTSLSYEQSSITIKEITMKDFGNYTCSASNDKGKTWRSFTIVLTVAQPPDDPINCTLEDLSPKRVNFACLASFDGGAPQNKYKLHIKSVNDEEKDDIENLDLDKAPRKNEPFVVSYRAARPLRRGSSYKVCINLCNKFGCSSCVERWFLFDVPTTPAPTLAPEIKLGCTIGCSNSSSLFPSKVLICYAFLIFVYLDLIRLKKPTHRF